MRNAQELNVDVTHRAANAADRTRTNRRLQGVFDAERQDRPEPRTKHWFEWENLIVAGREVKGIVITPAMGLTLVLAFFGAFAWFYKDLRSDISASRQEAREARDLMIEVKTRLEVKDGYDKQEFQKLHNRIDDTQGHQAAYETLMNKQYAEIKARR